MTRIRTLIPTAVLIAACAAVPAADARRPHKVEKPGRHHHPVKLPEIEGDADPLAPAGETPIPIVTVSHLKKGTRYLMSGRYEGEVKYCETDFGWYGFKPPHRGRIIWDVRPRMFFDDPNGLEEYNREQYYKQYALCPGVYTAAIRATKSGQGIRVVRRFEFHVPSMTVSYRSRR